MLPEYKFAVLLNAIYIEKSSADVCQLRLDFHTFSGFVNAVGVCTDTFVAAGQTGRNPPEICGTNTGYHSKYHGFF